MTNRSLRSLWQNFNLRKKSQTPHPTVIGTLILLASSTAIGLDMKSGVKKNEAVIIEASFETDPIPYGEKESDDGVVWVNPTNPSASLILGTSKYEAQTEGYGGLGVYTLDGHETVFLPKDRLNNIDIPLGPCAEKNCLGDRAVASNRSLPGISIFNISSSRIEKIVDIQLEDDNGKPLKVYGLCSAQVIEYGLQKEKKTLVLLPTKSGIAYLYELKNFEAEASLVMAEKRSIIDLKSLVTADQDRFIKEIVEKSARAEGELDELDKKLKDRFALEGCAYDHARSQWLIGMENFGIWAVPEKTQRPTGSPSVLIQVQGSWSDVDQWSQDRLKDRITDDIEGIDVFTYEGVDYAMFSIQGISEIGILELATNQLVGQFKVRYSLDNDPVLKTDGVSVKSAYLGPLFPKGVVILHDDANESKSGRHDRANYKIVSLEAMMKSILRRK